MGTGPEPSDAALRVSVRQRMAHGRLPVVAPGQVAAGYGSGQLCAVCDRPITSRQAEYEVEDSQTGGRLRFHAECHGVWQFECANAVDVASTPQR